MIQKYFSLFFLGALILSLVLVTRSHAATNGSPARLNDSKTKQVQTVKKLASTKVIIKKAPVKKPVTKPVVKPKPLAPKKVNGNGKTPMKKPAVKPKLPAPTPPAPAAIPQEEVSNSAQ